MTPHSIGILAIVMVVLTWIHYQGDFTLPLGTFTIKGCPFNCGIIRLLKALHNRTGTAFGRIEGIPIPMKCTGLVKIPATTTILLTKLRRHRIQYIHSVGIAIMGEAYVGIAVVTHGIIGWFISGLGRSRTSLMIRAEE